MRPGFRLGLMSSFSENNIGGDCGEIWEPRLDFARLEAQLMVARHIGGMELTVAKRSLFLCVFLRSKSGIPENWKGEQLAHLGHRET
jgi:hypothetical protein